MSEREETEENQKPLTMREKMLATGLRDELAPDFVRKSADIISGINPDSSSLSAGTRTPGRGKKSTSHPASQ
jgi:hypothetical protein